MVTASETADSCAFNLARLKEHTGNEGKLTAHFMRRDSFDFLPTHKLTFFGNHRPRVAHVDAAFRRRLKLLPFLHRPLVPDQSLKERLVPEYPGILRKLIDHGAEVHAALAQGNNLIDRLVPQAMRAASDAYLDDEDVVLAWARSRTKLDPKGQVTATEAYTDHQNWAGNEGRAPFPHPRKFTAVVVAAVNDSRCTVGHAEKGTVIMGLSLVPEGARRYVPGPM
jgi:putative DNA primase/helicase